MKPSAYGVAATPGRKVTTSALKHAVTAKARPVPAVPVAARPGSSLRPAVRKYTGMMAAPLNELSDAEQRAHDVAARRQADAQQYNAYVLGQQGKLAAAAHQQDQTALRNTAGIQLAAAGANAQSQQALQAARAAQGIGGAVPSQQLGGLVDDQQRSNLILAAASQRGADAANTNAGKAGFLAAAANAGLAANQRAIAGDEFQQTSQIRHEKVGVLTQRDQAIAQAASDAAKLQADQAALNARLDASAQDRSSREAIASAQIGSRAQIAAEQRALTAQQGRANRRTRLRTSKITAAAGGYVDPKERNRRATAVANTNTLRDAAVAQARQYVKIGGLTDPDDIRVALNGKLKNAPREVIDYALAAALGHKAGTAHGKDTATRRYYSYIERVKRGEVG